MKHTKSIQSFVSSVLSSRIPACPFFPRNVASIDTCQNPSRFAPIRTLFASSTIAPCRFVSTANTLSYNEAYHPVTQPPRISHINATSPCHLRGLRPHSEESTRRLHNTNEDGCPIIPRGCCGASSLGVGTVCIGRIAEDEGTCRRTGKKGQAQGEESVNGKPHNERE